VREFFLGVLQHMLPSGFMEVRHFGFMNPACSEDKIRIVLEGFRKVLPISDLCKREGISSALYLYYSWLIDFMEAGKARLKRDSLREANSIEVNDLRAENARLKELVGEQANS
jgi:transposase-like protein